MLPGECVNDTTTVCVECCSELTIGVLRSQAGYYIGFFCNNCGPYSRESGYYPTYQKAEQALKSGSFAR